MAQTGHHSCQIKGNILLYLECFRCSNWWWSTRKVATVVQ